jgi:hypothetical protein
MTLASYASPAGSLIQVRSDPKMPQNFPVGAGAVVVDRACFLRVIDSDERATPVCINGINDGLPESLEEKPEN